MIEEWNVTQVYANYYNKCQVKLCTYRTEMKNEPVIILTTVISVIGDDVITIFH